MSVVASPTINGPHSLTTDLLPLLSASIFTSEKITVDHHQLNIPAKAQSSTNDKVNIKIDLKSVLMRIAPSMLVRSLAH